jgi:hypothetical protein
MKQLKTLFTLILVILIATSCASAKKNVSAKGGEKWTGQFKGKTAREVTAILGQPLLKWYDNTDDSHFNTAYVKSNQPVPFWKVVANPGGYKCFSLLFSKDYEFKYGVRPLGTDYYEKSCAVFKDLAARYAKEANEYKINKPDLTQVDASK